MNLIECYALSCGLKIAKPFISEQYYPIPFDKYITIQNSNKGESRKYDLFEEVIVFLKKYAPEYKIVLIGGKDESPIEGVDMNLLGQTNMRQMAFIVKNAALHIGPDSFPAHLAGHFNTPLVALYPQMYSSQSRPYFGERDRQVLLESDRKGLKPTYSMNESPKSINTIKPDNIVNKALSLLGKSPMKEKVVLVSEKYPQKTLNVLPLNPKKNTTLPGGSYSEIIVHADLLVEHLATESSLNQAQILNESVMHTLRAFNGTKVRLKTSVPIHPEVLKQGSASIGVVEFLDSQYIKTDYLQLVKKLGVNFIVSVDENDVDAKIKYLDFIVKHKDLPPKNEEYRNFIDSRTECDTILSVKSNFIFINDWNEKKINNYESILVIEHGQK